MSGPTPRPGIGGGELLRSVGLLADGPVVLGRPLPARGPGVWLVELPAPLPTAPIELTKVGKWLERVETLRLDGERPSSRALAARLAAFWIPSAVVVHVGVAETSIGAKVAAMEATPLGDRRPNPTGHWLKALRGMERARVWWAATTAVEESLDALLEAFATSVPETERASLPDRAVVLPFATLRSATGERKATGLTESLLAAEPRQVVPPPRVVEMPPGAAEGAGGLPPSRAAGGTVRRGPRPAAAAASSAPRRSATPAAGRATRRGTAPTQLSAEGAARLREELHELTEVQRPEVIGRIRAAKELGDLKENADYTSAREAQSFLEGRIAAIEGILRTSVVVEPPATRDAADAGSGSDTRRGAVFGSRVTVVAADGGDDPVTYELVGSAEADATAGRISTSSPVGRALLGREAGDEVEVTTPRGPIRYRIVELA